MVSFINFGTTLISFLPVYTHVETLLFWSIKKCLSYLDFFLAFLLSLSGSYLASHSLFLVVLLVDWAWKVGRGVIRPHSPLTPNPNPPPLSMLTDHFHPLSGALYGLITPTVSYLPHCIHKKLSSYSMMPIVYQVTRGSSTLCATILLCNFTW
jgi:hypothetical protein